MAQSKVVAIEVQQDHLERVVHADPIVAISELIWNALDADATEVHVEIDKGTLANLGAIRVIDNGTGIPFDTAEARFKSLGNSWKINKEKTDAGRFMHGEKGQGRFKAFSLGNEISWTTHSIINGKNHAYKIIGSRRNLRQITISAPEQQLGRGTIVEIGDIEKDYRIRWDQGAVEKIGEVFALYLYQYPHIKLTYDGVIIDGKKSIAHLAEYDVTTTLPDGQECTGILTVAEWHKKVDRKLMLCLPGPFPFKEILPGIQARGFDFTAYLASERFKKLVDENREELIELDPLSGSLIDTAKNKLKAHFREREASKAKSRIDQWKTQNIYPYEGEPEDPIERNERNVFNVIAVNLVDYHDDFETTSKENQKLIFQLIKTSVETGPQMLPGILRDVIGLPKNKQEELAELLKKTSLTAIINAAKSVTERMDFLKALQILIFDTESKKKLLERQQLHRIIAEHTWIFGEHFSLTVDDNDLTNVLKRHLSFLGVPDVDVVVNDEVLDHEGKKGVIDLVLSKRIPLPSGEEREHLVIELKRPNKPIDGDAINQLTKYALAISKDDRFVHTRTKWTFVAISNQLDPVAEAKANQQNRPRGLVEDIGGEQTIQIWAKTWSQIIQDNEGRLKFFRDRLEYSADDPAALQYLSKMNEKYLSPSVLEKVDEARKKDKGDDSA